MVSKTKSKKAIQSRTDSLNASYGRAVADATRKKMKIPKVSKETRLAAMNEKGFTEKGYACVPWDETPRKILSITDTCFLMLEGLEHPITPCTALPAEKPKRKRT